MAKKNTKGKGPRGAATNLYMHSSDAAKVRELAAFVAAHYRTSDSMLIRACILLAEPGEKFLKAYAQIMELDGRRK